ncbi:MAG: hypothetical protein Q7R70_03435 [Candidatus Diapherotrites archaeon]|nr:hypothetical protein [Candidatus Diapherotrites archaeon]
MGAMKKIRAKNLEIGLRIRNKAIEKALKIKNPRAVFKYFSQILIVFLIAAGIYVWVDPAINFIPAPLSYFFLAVLIVLFAYIHFAFKAK